MKGFKNVRAYIEGKGIITTDIAVENGIIVEIGSNLDITEVFPYQEGQVVIPGFIDQHIHGASGADTMDGSMDALNKIANNLCSAGTTSFLATTMTQSNENIEKALNSAKNYINSSVKTGARLVGVNLEGPFISEKHVGAQPLKYVQDPTTTAFDNFYKASGNNIKLVTIAPEENGAMELIAHASKLGVVSSAGHCDAGCNFIIEAQKNGLSCITHTFNAQRGIHHREIGTAGAGLILDDVYCEAICDLIHLSVPTIKLIVKTKPKDKIILVTDSIRAQGIGEGLSELGGQKVIVKNGEARLENGALAGSTLTMNTAIKNLVLSCDVPFTDAVDFATKNPAKCLNIFNQVGSIAKNKRADFAVLDGEFNVCLTVRDGEIIYKA